MIELIATDTCTTCNVCVRACPNDVFDAVSDNAPRIARPQDCHTCFLCELYCPVDAIYVSPIQGELSQHYPALPAPSWGSYAAASGWKKGLPQISKSGVAHD